MGKPVTMCNETGCTRDWTTVVLLTAPFSMTSTHSNSLCEKKVCDPCAVAHERNVAREN